MYVAGDPINDDDLSGKDFMDFLCGNRFVRRLADFLGFGGHYEPNVPINFGSKAAATAFVRGLTRYINTLAKGTEFFAKAEDVKYLKGVKLTGAIVTVTATVYNVVCGKLYDK